MDKKPIQYNYNGEILYIYPGNYFSKNELIIRLKEMNFTFADTSYDKQDLVTIYEIATSYENNIEKIISRLRKDYQYMNQREKLQKENHREQINNNSDIFNNFRKKFFFENNRNANIPSVNNFNNINNNEPTNPSNDSSSKTWSAYFFKKIKEFLYNNKLAIIQKVFWICVILCMDLIISYISQKYYLIGKILKEIRKIVTPKRLIILFLLYHLISYIINSVLHYVLGFGIFGLLLIIFKDKLKEFFLNLIL